MTVTSRITVDLTAVQVPPVVYAKQYDEQTRVVELSVTANGVPFEIPSGVSAIFQMAKPDGTYVFYDADENNNSAISIKNSTVSVTLLAAALQAAGTAEAQVNLYEDGGKLTTISFVIIIQKSTVPDDAVSETYFNILTQQVSAAQDAAKKAEELVSEAEGMMTGSVRFDIDQSLTLNQKSRAQKNISAYPQYTSLGQIGCSAANTVEEVFFALPAPSRLLLSWVNKGQEGEAYYNTVFGNDMPNHNYGTFILDRTSGGVSVCTYHAWASGTGGMWYQRFLDHTNGVYSETEWLPGGGAVFYHKAQTLTSAQKTQAINNMGAVPTSRTVNGKALNADISLSASDVGAVSYAAAQTLTSAQKTQAINNIGVLPIATGNNYGAQQVYTSLSQLGLSNDNSLQALVEALPSYSKLILRWIGTSTGTGTLSTFMPDAYGTLVVEKPVWVGVAKFSFRAYKSDASKCTEYVKLISYVNDAYTETPWRQVLNKADYAISTGTLTFGNSAIANQSSLSSVQKCMNMVTLSLHIRPSAAQTDGAAICTVPAGFRPARTVYFSISGASGTVYINTAGEVLSGTVDLSANTNYSATVTYPAAN